jgi:hypothetical protein
MRSWGGWLWVGLWACGFAGAQTHVRVAAPQSATSAVPATTAGALVALGGRAGVIFAGHVVEVRRNDEAGFVDVVFHVDEAVRGCGTSSTYVLREWAGLWSGQAERYLVGQRLLMLLAGRGPGGMSAPVGGMAGTIPLVATRQPPLTRGTGVAPAETAFEDSQEEAVDLRWVQALGVPGASAAQDLTVRGEDMPQPIRHGPSLPVKPVPPAPSAGSPGPSLSAVLALLGGGNAR